MSFQTSVNLLQAFGVVGELIRSGPLRAFPATLVGDTLDCYVGYAYTITSEGVVAPGGSNAFAGILANPKVYASSGTAAGGTLAPTLIVPDNSVGEIVEMGTMLVDLGGACSAGDLVIYEVASGALSSMDPADYLPVGYAYAYGVVREYNPGANGLAVVDFNYSPTAPVAA